MSEPLLATSLYLVLALLSEGDAHGYDLHQQAWNRGFRYWTDTKRSAIYGALKKLAQLGLVQARNEEGGGPTRKVYAITPEGRRRLAAEAVAHLAAPDHPRNELDLGIYALPFVDRDAALAAMDEGLDVLRGRNAFLRERLDWCRARELDLPALAFERALASSEVNTRWLESVRGLVASGALDVTRPQWAEYEYRMPPEPRVPEDSEPGS